MAASNESCASEPGNDLMLLERVFLRLGSADTDQQLETCVTKFLPPVLLKLASPHEQVRTKVMELLVHINKRVRCRSEIQLPLDALLSMYQDEKATSFVINFAIIYISMGFPRLPIEKRLEVLPRLLSSIAARPQSHQDDILLLVMPILGDLGNKSSTLDLKSRPQQTKLLLRLALDLLLLPYGALPGSKEAGSEFPVPPGLSPQAYKKLTEKNTLDASQLETTKQSIVKFLTNDAIPDNDTLLPLVVAAADSRFSVANIANVGLGRIVNVVDWSDKSVVAPLYSLFLGGQQQRTPACTRIRLKLLHYLARATGPAILFPHCIQVIFASLFAQNTNPRLKTLALNFTMNVIQSGDLVQLKRVSPVLLGGLLKLTKMEEEWAHHAQAFTCLGRLVSKAPNAVNKQLELLEELFNKMPSSTPELRLAVREALLAMASAFRITTSDNSGGVEPMEVCSSEPTVEEGNAPSVTPSTSSSAQTTQPQDHAPLIVALLEKHLDSEDHMVRFVAARYASVLFPPESVSSKYLLLLASGDSKEEVKVEGLKSLYGTSRSSEIEDVVRCIEREGDKGIVAAPSFVSMLECIWSNITKRKQSSNSKHRFVLSTHVLPFPPDTYYEMMRYLRLCLNRDAGIKNGSPHPSSSSPILSAYLKNNLCDSESLQHYITMVKILLSACPDIVPFTCLLDIVGCIPEKMSQGFVDQLPFFRNHFTTSTREDVRDTAATLYAIVKSQTADRKTIEEDIAEMIDKSRTVKNLESQCGYIAAYCSLLERSITLWKMKTPAQSDNNHFNIRQWKVFVDGVIFLGECLSNSQSLLVSYACQNLSLLGKCYALPLPDKSEKDVSSVIEEKAPDKDSSPLTKLSIVDKLLSVLKSSKYSSKIKERATAALGYICLGEHFPHSQHIIKGFLELAKESKDIEIHLEIGESLVLCVDGVNSLENRDLWSEPLPQDTGFIRDNKALSDNDKLLDCLLTEIMKYVNIPHPNSRQASCIWLLALVKNCSQRSPVKTRLPAIQEAFMEFLSENSDIVQDVASKGLSLVYQFSSEEDKKEVVSRLVEQMAGGKRQVAQVTQDTKIFEEGQLGKTPTGGNLSTYKELCSFASDLNQPDLIYKFMHLANHNALWNSKKGAAFGFQSIVQQSGAQLSEHLPKIVPRLYRYRFDPTPKIQNSMSSIWHALVPETQKTVEKYHSEILNDLVTNLTANQWRIRISCCLALSDLLRTSRGMVQFLPRLQEIWSQLFRVMDDVHEGTRAAAINTAGVLSKLCIVATDQQLHGQSGKEVMATILPVLLEKGITNTVAEVRHISLQTVSKLVVSAGSSLKPFLSQLIPGLLVAAGELESSKLSYLSTALAGQSSQDTIDNLRAHAAKAHYTTETVTKCIQYVDVECMESMIGKLLELVKAPQLGSKVGVSHALGLLALHLGPALQPHTGKILSALVNGLLDRNATVRKHYADTIGTLLGCAKDSSCEKLLQKLCLWYRERDDEAVRSAISLTLHACSTRHPEMLKEKSHIIMPTIFMAMHAEKTPDSKSTVELYEEVWSDICGSKEQGIRKHLEAICKCLEEGIASPSWNVKAQAGRGMSSVAVESRGGLSVDQRAGLVAALLEGLKGRTWEGKHELLAPLPLLCSPGPPHLPDSLHNTIIDTLVRECNKQEPNYKKHCLTSLSDLLSALNIDRFQQVYDILHDTLTKDVGSVQKDSDDDEFSNEASLQKKEQLISLKEVAYQTLGKAWPDNIQTQEKYQRIFGEHCWECIGGNTRIVQVSILTALNLYVEKLLLLNIPLENMDAVKQDDLQFIIRHIVLVLDYAFGIKKHTRLRKEALNILSTTGKKLKENQNMESFNELKKLYSKYEEELVQDHAPEIRSRLVHIKLLFQ